MAIKKYRACLIGCGRMGATIDDEVQGHPGSVHWLPYSHAAALRVQEKVAFVAVSDVVAEKVETIRRRYEVARGYTDYREMLEQERPELVCIATRPATHAELVRAAAESGVKGIYCEKPLCCSMAEADAMLEACQRHGVCFNYGTQRRYMQPYLQIRQLIQAGELGQVQAVIAHCGVGAALWSQTHTADMVLFLAGDAPVEYVQGIAQVEPADFADNRVNGDPGIPMGYARFANGVHGYFTAATGYEFEVSGTQGKLRSCDDGSSVLWRRNRGGSLLEQVAFPAQPARSGTAAGLRDLIDALDTGRQTQGPLHLALRSQELVMGLVESERLQGARVPLPLQNRSLYIGREGW